MIERVADAADPRLAPFGVLREPERAARDACFFLEGRRLVAAALARPRYALVAVLATEAALRALAAPLAAREDVPCLVLSPALLEAVAGWRFHQGCLAAAQRPAPSTAAHVLAALDGPGPVLALDEVANPDNVGAIARSARGLGARALVLSPGTASPLYRKALRASMGAALDLPFAHGAEDWAASLEACRSRGLECVALEPTARSEPLDEWLARRDLARRPLLVLGAEGAGLRPATVAACEGSVRVPMAAGHDALNVAATAAIVLYALADAARRAVP